MTLPSNTYLHYVKRLKKLSEGLRWESRLRFVRSIYSLYPINQITSSTELKTVLFHIAFSLSFMDMCLKKHLPKTEQPIAIEIISQLLTLLDQVAIGLFQVPKRNKNLAKEFITKEIPKFFNQMENILCDIEVLLATAHAPLHRYNAN